MQQYDELFELRGTSYDIAMRRYPEARRAEFAQVIDAAGLRSGMVAGDVPAGGGYLQAFLPAGCEYQGHEPCGAFAPHHNTGLRPVPLLPLPWPDHALDVVISLAGIHHVDDKAALFHEMHRVTRSGGRLVISDVAEGSAVARFLDGFVGRHNSTGHEGSYLNAETSQLLHEAGWRVKRDETLRIPWHFHDEAELAEFCTLLFDIRRAAPAEIIQAVSERLGIQRVAPEGVALCWSLRTLTAEKTDHAS